VPCLESTAPTVATPAELTPKLGARVCIPPTLRDHLTTIAGYNQAQYALRYAVGE